MRRSFMNLRIMATMDSEIKQMCQQKITTVMLGETASQKH